MCCAIATPVHADQSTDYGGFRLGGDLVEACDAVLLVHGDKIPANKVQPYSQCIGYIQGHVDAIFGVYFRRKEKMPFCISEISAPEIARQLVRKWEPLYKDAPAALYLGNTLVSSYPCK